MENNIKTVKEKIQGFVRKRKFDEALDYLYSVFGTEITDSQYYFEKGKILVKKRKTKEAIASFMHSIKLKPEANKYNLVGRLQRQNDQIKEAIASYTKGVEIDPSNTASISELAYLYRVQGDIKKSDSYYSKIVPTLRKHNVINRTRIAQDHIDKIKARTYLEIGVERGINFFQANAPVKIAVDPRFKIPNRPQNTDSVYFYEVPSDDFFTSDHKKKLEKTGIDVALVDGLHTYEQSLRDMVNTVKYLNDGGIIVVHDCYPKNEAASLPDMQAAIQHPTFNGAWNGDVWKAIIWLRCNRKDLRVYTLDVDHGLGIIKKEPAESMLNYTDKQIEEMTYADFLKVGPDKLLNLKDKYYETKTAKQAVS